MSDIVFILGAGASVKSGTPTMKDFLDKVRDLSLESQEPHFKRVINMIRSLQNLFVKGTLNISNIEDVFSILEMANITSLFLDYESEQIPELILDLKKVIVETLDQTMLFPVRGNYPMGPEPYGEFVDLLTKLNEQDNKKVAVITYNYDLGIDLALAMEGIKIDYGFTSKNYRNNIIPLYKLHGSLNWGCRKDTREIVILGISEYFERYSMSGDPSNSAPIKLNIGTDIQKTFHNIKSIDVEDTPFIIPPVFEKAHYRNEISSVWKRAGQELKEARIIVVCGYSLASIETHFNHLYMLGTFGSSIIDQFIVYDPDKKVDARYKKILGPAVIEKYKFKELKFDKAISDLHETPL